MIFSFDPNLSLSFSVRDHSECVLCYKATHRQREHDLFAAAAAK